MQVLFVGENIYESRSGVVTVMQQLLASDFLGQRVKLQPIYTTGDGFSARKKLLGWSSAYARFLKHLPGSVLVHAHHAIGLNFWLTAGMVYLAKLFGRKSVLHNHAADFHLFFEGCPAWRQRLIIRVFEAADANIVLSTSWLAWYRKIAPQANWVMLPNSIELPKVVADKVFLRQEASLVYLARIEERKGFYNLMNIMPQLVAQYPQCKLYVAGQGDIAAVKALVAAKELQANVEVLGHINSEQRDALLRKGHILILPSYNEGLPMSLLEAMAYGVVPVTTPVGGIPDVVNSGENGVLVSPGDEPALFAGISSLLTNLMHYQGMSKRAQLRIGQDFNLRSYEQQLFQLYQSV